jgi:CheY-like chemotaxis protein
VTATEGIQKMNREKDFRVVLMDMMMPDMDGYEAIEAIRQTEGLKEIPVIAVTAQAMVGDKERCLEAGANDYISKPIDVDRLMQLLEKY